MKYEVHSRVIRDTVHEGAADTPEAAVTWAANQRYLYHMQDSAGVEEIEDDLVDHQIRAVFLGGQEVTPPPKQDDDEYVYTTMRVVRRSAVVRHTPFLSRRVSE